MADEEKTQTSFDGANFAAQVLGFKPIPVENKPPDKPEEKKPDVIETPLMKVTVKPDDFFAKINQETGYTFGNDEELIAALKKSKDFETKEEEYLKRNKLGEDYIAFFNSMPDNLKRTVVDFGAGQDYVSTIKQLFGGGEVDYNKSWNEYDDKDNLVRKYGEISVEDWGEMEDNAKKIAEKSAKKAYESERNSFINENKQRITAYETHRKELADKIIRSVDNSVDKLKKDLPDMDAKKVAEVKNKLLSNPIKDLFTDDGVYKEDAATKIAFAYYGQETMQQVIQRLSSEANTAVQEAAKKASQGAMEDHIRKANDKVPAGEDGQDKNPAEEQIKNIVKGISFEPSSGFRNRQQT